MSQEPSSVLRAVIVDRRELFRRGLRAVIDQGPDVSVVAEVAEPGRLVDVDAELTPDLILVGVGGGAPGESAPLTLDALREIRRLHPRVAVIVFIEDGDEDLFLAAVRSGADGVLFRDASADAILRAVAEVRAGGSVLDPRLTKWLFSELAAGHGVRSQGVAVPECVPGLLERLSPRERDVLGLLAQGRRNKEIAAGLGVSVGTVKTHLRHLFRKLSVDDRTSAVVTVLRGRQ